MFVDLLLTSPEQRQLKLLSAIRIRQRIEFTELSKLLGWPYVSTQQVYRRVVANYQIISGEKLSKDKLVKKCDWVNLQLTQYLIRHSVGYLCLTAAVRKEPKTVLNMGAQTVSNRLKPIVNWLKQRHLDYNRQTNEITGDERLIRLFGWQLFRLGGSKIELTSEEVPYYESLKKLLPEQQTVTVALSDYLKVTAIRLAQYNYVSKKSDHFKMVEKDEILNNVNLPEQNSEIKYNLVEVYWLQYMVTYSPYFVDTSHTKLVKPKERAVLPYLIQLIVKTVITRLRIYRSPLYFEQLDEFLMESVQFALLLHQPVMFLDQEPMHKPIAKLSKIIHHLSKDIPELAPEADLIVSVLSDALNRFIPRQQVDVGYPAFFDDYVVGILQQRLMTQFMSIDWHLNSLPVTTEVTTPTFRIIIQPEQPSDNQYYWLPWLSVSQNIQFLIQKMKCWINQNILADNALMPIPMG
ncbi:hypothetical protein IWT25_01751 [Secundilactobacillus pentosiphilus]|uniref:Mga helix-turn-helix domain-containing protein n=1 Tax=Secundilactobacillus pentosiphilus TaxID=1714682 RepID=A0A1Z5IXE9_9LACO|nr:helix-turn-helix domain-containing protein [Secundilactobacillus pentosiphilus]GAX06407.1 hypothetical protein IWT25_01751 [Secundilactobacillus pentosiphilus]